MKKVLCPLCKMTVDQDDTYKGYRVSFDYKKRGVYPKWAYADGVNDSLASHLINFHRLPQALATSAIVGRVLQEVFGGKKK